MRVKGVTPFLADLGGGKSLQFSIQGADLAELERLSRLITAKLNRIPGLVDLDSTLKPDKPTVAIQMKRDAASDLGLNVNAVAGALRTLVAGAPLSWWETTLGDTPRVIVACTPDAQTDLIAGWQRAAVAEERASKASTQAEQTRREADQHSQQLVSNAKKNADQIVSQAKAQAESLLSEAKTDAERRRLTAQREVDELTRQKDDISSHLAQVRQLLGGHLLVADLGRDHRLQQLRVAAL